MVRTIQVATQGWKIRLLGKKFFELSDHLGNVTMTVSDRKQLGGSSGGYGAQLLSYEQYYPFGSTQGGRGASGLGLDEYRYGFNGKEDDEEWGSSLIQNYGFRLYNPGIGRFLSVDPLAPEYPELTPYQFASNRVIDGIDLDGLEFEHKNYRIEGNQVAPKLGMTTDEYLKVERGTAIYDSYRAAVYTVQGARTFGSMAGTTFYNAGNWFFTGSTVGSKTYTNYWTQEQIRHGTTRSDEVQQQVGWLAIEEGAALASGEVFGLALRGAYRMGKTATFGVDFPSSKTNSSFYYIGTVRNPFSLGNLTNIFKTYGARKNYRLELTEALSTDDAQTLMDAMFQKSGDKPIPEIGLVEYTSKKTGEKVHYLQVGKSPTALNVYGLDGHDTKLIWHTHPSGNPVPSGADVEILGNLNQESSTIVPYNKPPVKFDKNTPTKG